MYNQMQKKHDNKMYNRYICINILHKCDQDIYGDFKYNDNRTAENIYSKQSTIYLLQIKYCICIINTFAAIKEIRHIFPKSSVFFSQNIHIYWHCKVSFQFHNLNTMIPSNSTSLNSIQFPNNNQGF